MAWHGIGMAPIYIERRAGRGGEGGDALPSFYIYRCQQILLIKSPNLLTFFCVLFRAVFSRSRQAPSRSESRHQKPRRHTKITLKPRKIKPRRLVAAQNLHIIFRKVHV